MHDHHPPNSGCIGRCHCTVAQTSTGIATTTISHLPTLIIKVHLAKCSLLSTELVLPLLFIIVWKNMNSKRLFSSFQFNDQGTMNASVNNTKQCNTVNASGLQNAIFDFTKFYYNCLQCFECSKGISCSWAICKPAPCPREITMPASHHSVFLQAGCPSCCPTNSVKALKAQSHT